MFYPAFVSLFVCLLATSRKTIDRIFMKILTEMYPGQGKKRLNFRSHPHLDPDLGIFKRIFQHCEMGHFSTMWLISLEIPVGSLRKFITRDASLDKKVRVTF